MEMKMIELNLPAQLDEFVINSAGDGGAEFLQSWFWLPLIAGSNQEIRRFGAYNGQTLLAVISLIRKRLPLGFSYWLAPRGPIGQEEASRFLIEEIGRLKTGAVFLRFEPANNLNIKLKKTNDLQPKQSWLIDLSNSEEEILAAMHQKTRYNIRLAEKKGVVIEAGSPEDVGEFWRLLRLTGARDGFRLHSREHYEALLRDSQGRVRLFLARFEGQAIAAGIFCFWGGKATYLHGASDNDKRQLMAPYLLQWEMIKSAKQMGCRYYDFFGIDEHKWPGVTRFKLGFSGRRVVYPGTFDAVFRPAAYFAYQLLRRLRRAL